MKVLIHLKQGSQHNYELDFGNKIKKQDLERLLSLGHEGAAEALLGYSRLFTSVKKRVVVDWEEAVKQADFVLGHPEF